MMGTVGVLVRGPFTAKWRAALALLWVGVALAGCSAGAPSAASGPEPRVIVTIASAADQPGEDGTLSFTVTADPAPSEDLQVSVRVSGTGTAMDPATVTATIAAGQTEVEISVAVDLSHARTVTAAMAAGSGYTVGGASSAEVAVEADPMQVAPPDVMFGATGSDSIEVTWTAPDTSLTITGYGVRWRTGSGQWSENGTAIAAGETSYTIAGLTPNTEYEVQIRARFDQTEGAWSQSRTATTQSTTTTGTPDNRPVISIEFQGFGNSGTVRWISARMVSDRPVQATLDVPYTVSATGNKTNVTGGIVTFQSGADQFTIGSIPLQDTPGAGTVTISIDPSPEYRLGSSSSIEVLVN